MISSTSCQGDDENKKFVLDILAHLRREGAEYGSRWRGPASPAELSKVIVEHCISRYEKKYRFDNQGRMQDTGFQQEKTTPGTQDEAKAGDTRDDKTPDAGQGKAKGEAKDERTRDAEQVEAKGERNDDKKRSAKQGEDEDEVERSIRQFFSDSINKIVRYLTLDANERWLTVPTGTRGGGFVQTLLRTT